MKKCSLEEDAYNGKKRGEVSCSIRLNENSCSNICHDSEVLSETSDQFFADATYGLETASGKRERQRNYTELTWAVTNARSLWAKTESAYEIFEELDLDLLVVSETWFHSCPALDRLQLNAEQEHGICFIDYCRKPNGNKNRGGGVSILYKKNKISLKRFNVKSGGTEMVVAKGKINNNTRPVFVIAVYISTRLRAPAVKNFIELISGAINTVKTEAKDPYILIAGDFNLADFSPLLADYPDLALASELPTRRSALLDLVFTNLGDEIEETKIFGPLTNIKSGSESDHRIVYVKARMAHKHKFEWVEKTHRPMGRKAVDDAVNAVNRIDWESALPSMEDPDLYVEQFHLAITSTCLRFLPYKKTRFRSTDDPWIDDKIRRKVRARKRIFKLEKRSRRWKKLKTITTRLIRKAKSRFYRREVEKMKQPGILPFKIIKRMKDAERPPEWSLEDLFPGSSQESVAEKTADFFSKISNEFEKLQPQDLPESYDRRLPSLSTADVAAKLSSMKVPKSYVALDIPPVVMKRTIPHLATAITPIINLIRISSWWPKLWKVEEVSVIPKAPIPQSLDQTRNISCTSIFSKLAEEYLLQTINEEVELGEDQFGGRKGCGTDHLLCKMSTQIMRSLDDNRACVNLMALDFAKAFNRMAHQKCLSALHSKGASNQTLRMTYAFLSNRSMKIKLNGEFSSPRITPGGAPQGTKVGNLLFSITTDLLTRDDTRDASQGADLSSVNELSCSDLGMSRFDRSRDFSFNVAPFDRRILRGSHRIDDSVSPFVDVWDSDRVSNHVGLPIRWSPTPILSFRYVDDQTFLETAPVSSAVSTISTSKEIRSLHSAGLSETYSRTSSGADDLGMILNTGKTQILCISDAISFDVSSCIKVGQEVIESQEEIKVLGYTFGSRPDARAQVSRVKLNGARRAWSIRHLKKAGVPNADLVQIYCSFVRSALEYASNVYGGYLTDEQSGDIERIQANILRSIFGQKNSYRKCLSQAAIPTLKDRRSLLFLKFAEKIENSDRFRERWLPKSEEATHQLRKINKYKQERFRCNRLRDSPIFRMRKILNDLARDGASISEEIKKVEEEMKQIRK